MNVLVILLILVLLALVWTIYSQTDDQRQLLQNLLQKVKDLNGRVSELTRTLEEQQQKPAPPSYTLPPKKEPTLDPVPELSKKPDYNIPPPPPTPVFSFPEEKKEPVNKAPDPVTPKLKEAESWFSRTDLEKFIGENLANKIGIAVLVLGISFFVKYAIDKDWINETGRVAIGFFCGALLIGIAHYIRNSYRSFSSVLVGGGLTILYFSIAFAFHQYQLLDQRTSFIFMTGITAFAVFLSVFYDRIELAILATLGGFVTPFLVSTGIANYIALFSYLGILCTGLMVLSWFKKWPVINIIALFFTTIIYASWLVPQRFAGGRLSISYQSAFFFLTLYYLLFVTMNILNNIRRSQPFKIFDFSLLAGVNCLYFAAGISVLGIWQAGDYQGLFTFLIGGFNLLLAGIFTRSAKIDRNFVFLLIALALSFISLAAPIQFNGDQTVLFWAAETVILYTLYLRTSMLQLRIASLIVSCLMILFLIFTWNDYYFSPGENMPVIFNRAFITSIMVGISCYLLSYLREKDQNEPFLTYSAKDWKGVYLFAALLVCFMAGLLEIYFQFSTQFPYISLDTVYVQCYVIAVASLLIHFTKKKSYYTPLAVFLTFLCFGIYVLQAGTLKEVAYDLLSDSWPKAWFLGHWISAILMGRLLIGLVKHFYQKQGSSWTDFQAPFTWIASISLVILLSVEMYQVMLWMNYSDRADWLDWENLYYKAGLSILWSICSFIGIWLGIKYGMKVLRVIALSLFTITLVKLFLNDIRNMPPGGKIAAFILLGVILLTVSFMYQRLKKIIIDDKDQPTENNHSI